MPSRPLPACLAPFFRDCDFRSLTWPEDRDLIIGRLLAEGSRDAVRWVRRRLGDDGLREWIEQREGCGLSPKQLRFREVVLKIPHARVTRWIERDLSLPWNRRTGP